MKISLFYIYIFWFEHFLLKGDRCCWYIRNIQLFKNGVDLKGPGMFVLLWSWMRGLRGVVCNNPCGWSVWGEVWGASQSSKVAFSPCPLFLNLQSLKSQSERKKNIWLSRPGELSSHPSAYCRLVWLLGRWGENIILDMRWVPSVSPHWMLFADKGGGFVNKTHAVVYLQAFYWIAFLFFF